MNRLHFKGIRRPPIKYITNIDLGNTHHELENKIELYHRLIRDGYYIFDLFSKSEGNTYQQPDFFFNLICNSYMLSLSFPS